MFDNFAVSGAIGVVDNAKFISYNSSYFDNKAVHVTLMFIDDKSEIYITDNQIYNNQLYSKSDFIQESWFCIKLCMFTYSELAYLVPLLDSIISDVNI